MVLWMPTLDRNVNYHAHFGKQSGDFSKKKADLVATHGPALSLLAMYSKYSISYYRGTYTFMLIAALFITNNQEMDLTRCPSNDEWKIKMWNFIQL